MSSKVAATGRPDKPYPDFPLFPHATGRWAKKIRGKLHYFGKTADGWEAALERYKEQAGDLHAGRTPRPKTDGLTLADLCNRFLTSKLRALEAGELHQSTFGEYREACGRLITRFGKDRLAVDLTPADFGALRSDLADGVGLHRISKLVGLVRSVFKFGYEASLLDRPVRFGPEFTKPSRKAMRRERAGKPRKLFTAAEVNKAIGEAGDQLKAMILLAINAGLGNSDCAHMPVEAIDLKGGWLDFPRVKTGVSRRAKLWPETVKALEAVLAARKEPKLEADKGIVFITKYGTRWVKFQENKATGKTTETNAVSSEFAKVLKTIGVDRDGVGFYSLRHTFRTIADETRDRAAIDKIMGHSRDEDMATHYVENIEDTRLEAVAEHVRAWLFAKPVKGKTANRRARKEDKSYNG